MYSYILIIIAAVISGIASLKVKSTYSKYAKQASSKGMTSEQVASQMLEEAGIYDVRIEQVGGNLTDHYSPKEKVLRLSDTVYGSTSVAAIGVAAHECGHAIQHQEGYGPLSLRSAAVPAANIGSKLSWPIILLGIFLSFEPLVQIGIVLFSVVVLFQIITLPVEFDASKRAMAVLEKDGILTETELTGAGKVLKAAAMTYVAAMITAILQLLRIILISRGGSSRRRSR